MRLVVLLAFFAVDLLFSQVPRTWDEEALRDWATPIAKLGTRPGHFSSAEYLNAPLDNFCTYPVYFPGNEPPDYWVRLQKVKPQKLIEAKVRRTEAEWIEDGKRVFVEYDIADARTFDPKIVQQARSLEFYKKAEERALPDGTVAGLRWIVTSSGIGLTASNCSLCHVRWMRDKAVPGAPYNTTYSGLVPRIVPEGVSFIKLPGDDFAKGTYRSYQVPWESEDEHKKLLTMKVSEIGELFNRTLTNGMFARWNGSPFYPTKVPDLIGIKDRKWIDATGTHQNRGPGDMMRYGALVSYSDSSDFGTHRILTDAQRKIPSRLPDEGWYALTMYLYSLTPPENPNRFDEKAAAGKQVFAREGCTGCHPAPLYTSNMLTLAAGYKLPADSPMKPDVLPISVGTDPGLAMKTRKGTGFYKVPSLRGVWYRGRYLHDGSFTTLEEMFNPKRLEESFAPSGWNPVGREHRAVTGHEFGLKLDARERTELMAFLRTL